MEETYVQLLQGASDCRSRARLLAAATKESGAWLHALPVSSLGLRMDDHTTRIAVGLRLGTPLCQPHICHHCGGHVDALATHGLSCIKSQGRFSRHAAINAIIHTVCRSLAAINVPSTLEPIGLYSQMASDLMVVPLPHGNLASVLFGTLLVWTPSQPHT